MISIEYKGKSLIKYSKIFSADAFAKYLSERYVATLKRKIDERTIAPSGNLMNGIYFKKLKKGEYQIITPYYFWAVNYGRSAGAIPDLNSEGGQKIKAWANRVGIPNRFVRASIRDFGTKPKYFYESANNYLQSNLSRYAKQFLKRKR